jgi:hypothetical protein
MFRGSPGTVFPVCLLPRFWEKGSTNHGRRVCTKFELALRCST